MLLFAFLSTRLLILKVRCSASINGNKINIFVSVVCHLKVQSVGLAEL